MMKRWFNAGKGTYEFQADVAKNQKKECDDHANIKPVQTKKLAASMTVETHDGGSAVYSNGNAKSVSEGRGAAEATAGAKGHRRQRSSGNWQILMGESEQLSTAALPSNTVPTNSVLPPSCPKNQLNCEIGNEPPIRKPVASKETTPLSFFKEISGKGETVRIKAPKQNQKLMLNQDGTAPTPTRAPVQVPAGSHIPQGHSCLFETNSSHPLHLDRKTKNIMIGSLALIKSEERVSVDINDPVEDVRVTENLINGAEEISNLLGDNNKTTNVTVTALAKLSHENNSLTTEVPATSLIPSSSASLRVASSRYCDSLHIKRNSDPPTVRTRRKRDYRTKRKSYPLGIPDQLWERQLPGKLAKTDLKYEILKISSVEAPRERPIEDQTFVLVNSTLNDDSAAHVVMAQSLPSVQSLDIDDLHNCSERYLLAVADGETCIDTSNSEESIASSINAIKKDTIGQPAALNCLETGYLKKMKYLSNLELATPSVTSRSFDETTSTTSERSSLASSKSYSFNDLSSLERPSGFGTLDMKNLLGSFQMLDSILSDYTTPTPDDPVDSIVTRLHTQPLGGTAPLLEPVRHNAADIIIEEAEDDLPIDTQPLRSDRSKSENATSDLSKTSRLRGSDAIPQVYLTDVVGSSEPFQLPWGTKRAHCEGPAESDLPGEFVMRKLFKEFTVIASRKIEYVLAESLERPLQKSLQRGEDSQLDQLLSTLNTVAEHCLPSLLKTLFLWYEYQVPSRIQKPKGKGDKDVLSERRDLAVEFLFCLVLIEVLEQLPFHPGYDNLVDKIIAISISHFRHNESTLSNPNAQNINTLADLYAEVIGVLARSRFMAVKRKFLAEIRELRVKETNPAVPSQIISLIMGLKFFRVKMHPIDEFEACVQFLHDLCAIFLDTKDKDIKHALAGLFVEIMLPMAAIVRTEVNVPVLRTFVEKMYPVAYELAKNGKKRNTLSLFPLVTCLLCVSQKTFFVQNWHIFLTLCLTNLKAKDPKMSRVALESLYRLVWVYMIRIKCESNNVTNSRLSQVVNALFPKGQKTIMPKDTPLNIYVKMIQFIAREKLDFAMREIIFDLLCVGKKTISTILPERMSIGLRAFLVIADNLQQKDGEPPMPQTVGVLPSGSTLRVKRTYINKTLTEEAAKNIGIAGYYPQVRKAFSNILRMLDGVVGKANLLTKSENKDKELDDAITPKLDLLRYCVAAIPRLMPSSDISTSELVEILLRYTVHVDEELRGLAYHALQNMLSHFWETRDVILSHTVYFIQHEILDLHFQLLDTALKMLQNLMTHWKTSLITPYSTLKTVGNNWLSPGKGKAEASVVQRQAVHEVEGLALVILCSCRPTTRKLAVSLLKEASNLMAELHPEEPCAISCIDAAIPSIMERIISHLPSQERTQLVIAASSVLDLQWLVDQSSKLWFSSSNEDLAKSVIASTALNIDPWVEILADLMNYDFVREKYADAARAAWPIVYTRLNALFPFVDPNNQANDQRSSGLLRARMKPTNERDIYINLWHNYMVVACCLAPGYVVHQPSAANTAELSSSPDSTHLSESRPLSAMSTTSETGRDLFRLLTPLLRCELKALRESCVTALGRCSPEALSDLTEELIPIIKEAMDRKQETVRKKKRRDTLRLLVSKLFQLLATNRILSHKHSNVIDLKRQSLRSTYIEFIDGARLVLENESDRDPDREPILQEIQLNFSTFISNLIRFSSSEYQEKLLSPELRYNLFTLFSGWSKSLGHMYREDIAWSSRSDSFSEVELASVDAMAAVLSCGKTFDPTGIKDKEGYVYPWLGRLLSCPDTAIYNIGKETCKQLLRHNADTQYLLDWTIETCYTGSTAVADGCFSTLVNTFTEREYPCDSVAMLNVALLYTGCPRAHMKELAAQLLSVLCKRFLTEESLPSETTAVPNKGETITKHQLADVMVTAYSQTQLFLSEHLARLHPELTIQIFSEICQRLDLARSAARQSLLCYLRPWLLNIELVNPGFLCSPFISHGMKHMSETRQRSLLAGQGWGSVQATEMVLNNILYLSVKFGDDHPHEVEPLWPTLVSAFPQNLRLCVKYLLLVSGISPQKLLPHAKRVVSYIARQYPAALVDELVSELEIVEIVPFNVERCNTAPFFKVQLNKPQQEPITDVSDDDDNDDNDDDAGSASLDTHSSDMENQQTLTAEEGAVYTEKLGDAGSQQGAYLSVNGQVDGRTAHHPSSLSCEPALKPYALPMPAFGGYFAPLGELMPDGQLLIQSLQRCFLSICLLTDMLVDNQLMSWKAHTPTLVHVIFLGFDHSKAIVYEHCKKALLNLILSTVSDSTALISQLLPASSSLNENLGLLVSRSPSLRSYLLAANNMESASHLKLTHSNLSINSISTLTPEVSEQPAVSKALRSKVVQQAALNVVDSILAREGRPLWAYETITSRQMILKSLTEMHGLLKQTLLIFTDSFPLGHLGYLWSQVALQFSLSCTSRHYAGRSLQILRCIEREMTIQTLSELTSRLVEVVCEQGEEMHGFVTEIMLTLESAVTPLHLEVMSKDSGKDLFISTPNLKSSDRQPSGPMKKSPTSMLNTAATRAHKRSTSVSISAVTKRATNTHQSSDSNPEPFRVLSVVPNDAELALGPSKTFVLTQTLEHVEESRVTIEEKLSVLVQMFWLGTSMLESDYEYEFLLATNLLKQILNHLQPDRIECRDRMERTLQQLNWPKFPGLQYLLVKGLTSTVTADATWQLLSHLTRCVRAPCISPSDSLGFPFNVMSLLPYMVQHYEEPNPTCIEAADNVAEMALEISMKLENLAAVMKLYSRGTFGKDALQWTKCVVKYLNDIYGVEHLGVITLLLEVLERGPPASQSAILLIIHCILNYVDICNLPSKMAASDLVATVSKFVEGPHWKEAQKILKLAVKSSSSLIPVNAQFENEATGSVTQGLQHLHMHTSFAEAEIFIKKDLPGRTLEFTFDISSTPLIGEKYILSDSSNVSPRLAMPRKEGALLSSPSMSSADSGNNWRRPHTSQKRVKERLVCLLHTLGQRVGVIKSPSVIFSQVSEHERQMSICSSSEETPLPVEPAPSEKPVDQNSLSDDFNNQYFRGFDFLDNESENEKDEGFNWGVIRPYNSDLEPERIHADSLIVPNDSTDKTLDVDEGSAKSTDDESTSAAEDHAELSVHHLIPPASPGLLSVGRSASSHSICSDVDIADINPVGTTEEVHTYLGMSADEVEEVWRSHVNLIIADSADDALYANTYSLFSRLFKETKRKMASQTQEVCFYLSKTASLREISDQFLKNLSSLLLHAECPFVFVDIDTASCTKVCDGHKFAFLEVNEAYVTYLDRRDQTQSALECIKESIKMQSLGSHMSDFSGDEQRIELCNSLYRLHFQLVILHSNYLKLIGTLVNACKVQEVSDLSQELNVMMKCMKEVLSDLAVSADNLPEVDWNATTEDSAEALIVEYLRSEPHKLLECILYIRAVREKWPGDRFGLTTDDDITACLAIYCRCMAEKKNGLLVTTRSGYDLSPLNKLLMDLKLQLTQVLTQFRASSKVEVLLKTSSGDKSPQDAESKLITGPAIDINSEYL